MPLPLVRLVLSILCLLGCWSVRAEPVSRTPPEIYARQLAPLLTPLTEVLAGRDAFADSKAHGAILLDEVIHFQDEQGINYLVYHDVYLARTDSAREVMGNRIYSYDREHDSIYLISAATIRPEGERQNLDDRAAFIQSPQREAENGLYTSEQELNLIFPNITPGAVTEVIVLIREDKPVFPDAFATTKVFGSGWPTYRTRLVVDLPDATMGRIRTVETSPKVPTPQTTTTPGRTRRIWANDVINELDWEESSPPLRFRAPAVWLSTIDSWDRIAAWFSGLVKGRDELGPGLERELELRTAGLTDRRAIVDRLCSVVANEVRYTGLEFGLAGYQPYPCAEVWANRYGDCKDKANLLRALLARKGIPAHFLLLNTGRLGRIETRSPSWKQFNHVILAVEDGAGGYWYCDPTVRYLPAGRLALGDSARPVMLVNGDSAQWRQTPDTLDNIRRYRADLALSASGELNGWFTIEAEGADAAAFAEYYNNYKPSDRRRTLQSTIEDFYPGAEVIDVDYTSVTESRDTFQIRAYLLRKAAATAGETIPFGYPADWLPSVDTASERLFPYAASRRIQSFEATVALPPGWNAAQLPPPFQAESAAASFAASWQAEASTLRMKLSWHPAAAEVPARDYAVLQRSVRALRTWLEQPGQIAKGAAVAGPVPTTLQNFPLLPTGEGQLRLLGERFPSGEREAERRAALEQTIQWFPDDAATTFTARVYLALLAPKDDYAGIARRIGEILQQYGTSVSPESRGWARYLQYRNQWWADHNPAALQSLRELAADTTLSDYRRAWSAHYAALFLAEKDPAAALALLSDWDVQPGEARENMLKAEAGYLARLADPAITTAWARRLVEKQADDADNLLALTLAEVLSLKDRYADTALGHFAPALAPVLTEPARYPKTSEQLRELQALGDAGRLRREFVAALSDWIRRNPRPWLKAERSPRFPDLASLEKHLNAMNDAHDGKAVVDAAFQLARFHECDYVTFAKYLYWAAWWLEKEKFDPELLAELAHRARALPNEGTESIGEIWLKQASAEQAAQHFAGARAEYAAILALPSLKPFQRVEAGGELALMELAQGNTDAALAAFTGIVADHLSHKRGSSYLTAGVMLQLELGHWDQAQAWLDELAKTKQEYRDDSTYAVLLRYLLASHAQPAALRAYWERRAVWRPAWDRLLAKYRAAPASATRPPLVADVNELQNQITTAATARDATAYLRNLDLLVRTAQFIPIYMINACSQTVKAHPLPDALRRDLLETGLLMVQGFPDFEPAVHWDARLWELAFLTDLGRTPEAAQAARRLYSTTGPSDKVKSAALQIWLQTAGVGADATEAIATATRLLEDNSAAADRADLVATLSDALTRQPGGAAANVTLIARELKHADLIAQAELHQKLTTRLNTLRQDTQAGASFTRELQGWLRDRHLEHLALLPPQSLAEPRYATPGASGLYEPPGLTGGEALKCNLLLALDEHRPMELRFRAFSQVVASTGYLVPLAENYAEHIVSAARLKSLPDNIRFEVLSSGIAFLAKNGHPSAEKILDGAAGPAQREALQKAYASSFVLIETFQDYSLKKAQSAFRQLIAQPLGGYESRLVRALISRMVLENDAEPATALLEEAAALQTAAGSGLSPAGLRLDWSRHLRRETVNLPLYQRIRDLLTRQLEPKGGDVRNFRRLTWLYSLDSLPHRERAQAIAAAFAHNLFTVAEPAAVLGRLGTATDVMAQQRDLGRDIELAVITAPEPDDATRTAWLEQCLGLADLDDPATSAAIAQAIRTTLVRTENPIGSNSRRTLRMRLALLALHLAVDERPEDLFGRAAEKDVDASTLPVLQLAFLSSRDQRADATGLMQQLDADQVAALHAYPYAATLLEGGGDGEKRLLQAAAKENLRRQLGDLWLEPRPSRLQLAAHVATLLDARDLLTEEFFAHAIAVQADEIDRQGVRLAQASIRDDWPALKSAANAVLKRIPDHYETVFFRGVALHHLGDHAGARRDLELYLAKSLDSGHRVEARRLLQTLPP